MLYVKLAIASIKLSLRVLLSWLGVGFLGLIGLMCLIVGVGMLIQGEGAGVVALIAGTGLMTPVVLKIRMGTRFSAFAWNSPLFGDDGISSLARGGFEEAYSRAVEEAVRKAVHSATEDSVEPSRA